MGLNDPEAGKLKPKSRGIIGASMPSRRAGDPRNYRSEGPMLSDRLIGPGLVLTNDGKIAVDFDAVERSSTARFPEKLVMFHAQADANAVDTAFPATERFIFGSSRHVVAVDLTDYNQIFFFVNKRITASPSGATAEVKYALTYSDAAADYSQIGTAPVSVATNASIALLESGWIDLVPEAKGPVYVGVVTAGGDSGTNPAYGSIGAYLRR